MTRYVLIGAGAVGGALGGLLARRGTDVVLAASGDHGRAMSARGVTLRCPDATFDVPVPVVTSPDEARLGVDDVLVLTTKTHQAEAAVGAWSDAPVHGPAGDVVGRAADLLPVLTALNGVASEEIALRRFGRVLAVCVWFPTVMISPGEVIVRTAPLRGVFHVGRYGIAADPGEDTALLDGLEHDWGAAGCVVRRPAAVMDWKYRKLLANVGNVLQALLGDVPGADDIARDVEAEARATLVGAGIGFVDDEESRDGWQPDGLSVLPVPGEPAQLGGSTWQSLMRGSGGIETDYLNGEIALVARRTGQAAPLNTRLCTLARLAAREGHRPGAMSPDQLRAALVS